MSVKKVTYASMTMVARETTDRCFKQIIDNALAHIRANIEPARERDPEGVHQLHIGTRRSRSALRMFKPQLALVVVRYFDKELRDDGLVLGNARDWDVFVSKTLHELPGADDMHKRAIHQQTLAHHRVERFLADPRFEGILAKLAGWTREVSISQAAIETVVPDLLDRLAKRVTSRRRAAGINDETSLHRLRKSLKDLRYSIEFTSSLYRTEEGVKYLDHVKDTLNILGDMHDSVVTRTLASQLTSDAETGRWVYLHHLKVMRRVPKAINDLHLKAFW